MNHILIITGGYLNIGYTQEYIKTLSYDKVFAVDKGLEYADALGLVPELIIGDFDTVDEKLLDRYEKQLTEADKKLAEADNQAAEVDRQSVRIIRHPSHKDQTDTELALYCAKEDNASRVTILGATGSRLDHVLANIGLLLYACRSGMDAAIIDEHNRIRLLTSEYGVNEVTIDKAEQYGSYVSLIPVTPVVSGVTTKGLLYSLDNAVIEQGNGLTVSNEIIEKTARIQIESGAVLIIESGD